MDAKGIARALRTQLQHIGHDVSHSQALELVAKTAQLKDWNVLSVREAEPAKPMEPAKPKKAAGGYFCPGCGKRGTVEQLASAFVEQGCSDGDSYLYEGNANHWVCGACGHQFLEWSSSWPAYQNQMGFVLMVQHHLPARWTARLYSVGTVLAILEERGWGPGYPGEGNLVEPEHLVEVLHKESCERESNALVEHLAAFGLEPSLLAQGSTFHDSVKTLLMHLPSEIDEQVLNRSIGIG